MPGGFEGLNWTHNAVYEQQSGDWILDKRNALSVSEKKGLFGGAKADSADFQAVIRALDNINDVLDISVSDNNDVWQTSLRLVFKGYEVLQNACRNYLTNENGKKRSARSSVGKKRLQIVAEISALADMDMECLMVQRFENPANVQERTVRGMLQKARTRVIEMKGMEKDHEHVGGAASNLTVLSREETGGMDGFFGIDKTLTKGDISGNLDQICLEAAERTGLSKEKFDQVRAVLGSFQVAENARVNSDLSEWSGKLGKMELTKDPEIKAFSDMLSKLASGLSTAYENSFQDVLSNASSKHVNLGNRNVASSRVAEMLGVGNLIAKSERVELREQGKSTGKIGNFMEKAKGAEADKTLGMMLLANFSDNFNLKDQNVKKAVGEKVKSNATASFQKDMMNLQVIDYLCGQIDRHNQNYFVQQDEKGNFIGVQGIDNDLSFGNAQRAAGEDKRRIGAWGKIVVSEDGDLYIPFMSKELAIAINSTTESVFRYVLKDLIEEADIAAFCERLKKLQGAIRKEMSKKPGESKLLSDNQWNQDTLNVMLNAEKAYSSGEIGTSNYMGQFMAFAQDNLVAGAAAKKLLAKSNGK